MAIPTAVSHARLLRFCFCFGGLRVNFKCHRFVPSPCPDLGNCPVPSSISYFSKHAQIPVCFNKRFWCFVPLWCPNKRCRFGQSFEMSSMSFFLFSSDIYGRVAIGRRWYDFELNFYKNVGCLTRSKDDDFFGYAAIHKALHAIPAIAGRPCLYTPPTMRTPRIFTIQTSGVPQHCMIISRLRIFRDESLDKSRHCCVHILLFSSRPYRARPKKDSWTHDWFHSTFGLMVGVTTVTRPWVGPFYSAGVVSLSRTHCCVFDYAVAYVSYLFCSRLYF